MSSASDIAADYGNAIRDLTCNNKTQINMLTILAEDYKDVSPTIVNVLEDEIQKCPPSRKILLLYVIDSIIKNIPESGEYRLHFAKNIAKIFTHVFEESSEKTRALLYKLRQTWVDIFPPGKLHDIDMRVHTIDGAWPLTPIGRSSTSGVSPSVSNRQNVHVNPKFFKTNGNDDTNDTTRHVAIKSEPIEPAVTTELEKPKLVRSEAVKSVGSISSGKAKNDVMKGLQSRDVKSVKKEVEDVEQVPQTSNKIISPSSTHATTFSAGKNNRFKKNRDTSPKVAKSRISPTKKALPMMHKFEKRRKVQNESCNSTTVATNSCKSISPNVPLLPPHVSPLVSPSPAVLPCTVSQRPPLLTSGKTTDSRTSGESSETWRPAAVSTTAVTSAVTTVNDSWRPQNQIMSMATISNETPRLPRLPTNNRVFIDGKAYEVIFLCDVPVIIRNGLPHRVSFSGPPRDIMIDGILHKLAFGEVKTVIIDNEPHPIRFGAPSREFYMRDKAFRGVFGGPPIIVSIDGRRHEIRLLGPPPEAKIEQDPSYELTRYMTATVPTSQQPAFNNSAPTAVPGGMQPHLAYPSEPTQQNTSNMFNEVNTLLKKLRYSGILGAITSQKKVPEPTPAVPLPDTRNSDSPPIPSTQRLDNIERRAAPMSALDQFSMRSLAVRYDSVISALLKDRVECPSCGIAIKELYGEAYHQHTAWHMRVLKSETYTRSRPWFMREEWFSYSETDFANNITVTDIEKAEDKAIMSSETTTGDALSSDIDVNECYVCNEKFEEYFDEDDDAWKLRDCVVVEGKAYHRYCKTDAAATE